MKFKKGDLQQEVNELFRQASLQLLILEYQSHQANEDSRELSISSILQSKVTNLKKIFERSIENLHKTKNLEAILLSYIDHNINKVENHLLRIDFWQNHNLHSDIIHLRTQMQQQLFQLEQEKVRAQINLNNQVIQLSKESRIILKELYDLEMKHKMFVNNNE